MAYLDGLGSDSSDTPEDVVFLEAAKAEPIAPPAELEARSEAA